MRDFNKCTSPENKECHALFNGTCMNATTCDGKLNCLPTISAPSPSSVEIAVQIGKDCLRWSQDPDSPGGPGVYFDAQKAAALIDQARLTLPRKMLKELRTYWATCAMLRQEPDSERETAIVAQCGYTVEKE